MLGLSICYSCPRLDFDPRTRCASRTVELGLFYSSLIVENRSEKGTDEGDVDDDGLPPALHAQPILLQDIFANHLRWRVKVGEQCAHRSVIDQVIMSYHAWGL